MNITVKPELEKLIENQVVIARDLGEDYNREEIEEKIARGLAELERGEGIDGDEFFDQLRLHREDLKRERL